MQKADWQAGRGPCKLRTVKLYVKVWCPWCIDAERWLDRRGYRYDRIDVLSDAQGYARMKEISGQSLTPTLETADGRVLPDFDTGQLERFLDQHGIVP